MTIHWAAGLGAAHRMLCSPFPIYYLIPYVNEKGIKAHTKLSLFQERELKCCHSTYLRTSSILRGGQGEKKAGDRPRQILEISF